jgi:peptidoglycan/LPS O-acetylase OafA/YrhL
VTVRGQRASIAGIGILTLVWLVLFYGLLGSRSTTLGAPPVLELRQYAVAVFFMVFGIIWRNQFKFRFFSITIKPFARISHSSYALYAIHWPILLTSKLFSETLGEPWRLLALLAIIFSLAYFVEVKVQNWINRRTARFLR